MTIIDLIRHGEPDTSIHDDCARPLTLLGRQQAQQLARQLHDTPYTAIYSSPLLRAVETITPLASAHCLTVIRDHRLVERKMPNWFATEAEFSGSVAHQWEDLRYCRGGGESIQAAQSRYLAFMQELPANAWVAAGAHGTAMSSVVEAATPGAGFRFWKQLRDAEGLRVTMHSGAITQLAAFRSK
ncbi:histidine phosphatase family protein [Lacticaseibacillus jixianensis]|uniref:Histidine phosphatase family protein n=1 Tax=Lacticaseibacillus jixianensis TaxID=2486012 RepID=A0ABW4B887_9LACO|nr:histidine phosphatase family protein [Lacticaseibacillus jixianensis]